MRELVARKLPIAPLAKELRGSWGLEPDEKISASYLPQSGDEMAMSVAAALNANISAEILYSFCFGTVSLSTKLVSQIHVQL